MDFMLDSLNAALHTPGEGTVISFLQSLQWAHVVKLETTGHGVFAKMLYRQGSSSRRKIFLQSLVAPPLPVGLPPRPPTDGTVLEAELHEADESWDHFLSRESSLVASPHVHEDTICKNLDCGGQPVRKLSLDQEFTAMCKEDNVARDRRFVENQYDRNTILESINCTGEWVKLDDNLEKGMCVKTVSDILSYDKLRIYLDTGLVGKVLRIDSDGDALIQFVDVPELGTSCRWIQHSDFSHLCAWQADTLETDDAGRDQQELENDRPVTMHDIELLMQNMQAEIQQSFAEALKR